MKTRMFALAVLALCCISAPVAARQASDTTAVANDAARAADERMVCERRKVIGSNKVERICKTAKQWREEREGAQYQAGKQATQRMMQSGNVCADARCGSGQL